MNISPPTNLTGTPVDDQSIQLTWNDNCSFEAGYRLERSEDGVSFTQIAELGENITEYTDTGLNYGTGYTYRVKAFTDINESDYATSSAVGTVFPSPTDLEGTPIDDQSIQLTWSDNCVFEDGYRLERSEDGVSFTQIAELGENITEYTDTGLNYGTGYTYRVKAFTDINESDYATSNTTTMNISPPTNLTGTPVDDQSIQLTWNDNCSFEAGYRLERSEDGGSFTQITEVDADVTDYTDTGLNYGTDYTYRVKAFTDINESDYATSSAVGTVFPSPTDLEGTPVDDQSIQLTWNDNCSFEAGYRLERSTDGGSFTQITEVDADVTDYTDTGLNYGTDYTYRVKAFTDINESDYVISSAVGTVFQSPTNLTAQDIDDQSIQLTWTDNCSFESGYRLERSEDGSNFSVIAELGEDLTEYTDTGGLTVGIEYTYRVKAFTDANESDYAETTVNFWQDCNGDWDGTAFENACEYCVSGNTGLDETYCDPVTDIDGNEYETVIIGNQIWMAENLQVTHYRNGDAIPTGYSDWDWAGLSTGAYAVYVYGYLYNWYAIDDSRNIAPDSWHVPTDAEWITLKNYLTNNGHSGSEGTALKATYDWLEGGNGTDNYGFTGLPGGDRSGNNGAYINVGYYGFWWTHTEDGSDQAWSHWLYFMYSGITRVSEYKDYGFSVRCIKD
jgi:uncharacterized protein (TIGR02145 family)